MITDLFLLMETQQNIFLTSFFDVSLSTCQSIYTYPGYMNTLYVNELTVQRTLCPCTCLDMLV